MEKEIGKYKINFFGKFTDETEKLELTIVIDNNLKDVLKKCISTVRTGFKDSRVNLGYNQEGNNEFFNFKRYLIRTPMNNIFSNNNAFDLLFSKEIIESGKVTLNFLTYEQRNNLKTNFKSVIKTLLMTFETDRVVENVSYTIKVEE